MKGRAGRRDAATFRPVSEWNCREDDVIESGRERISILLVAPLCAIAFLATLSNHSIQPFLPQIVDDLNSSVPVVGQAGTVSLLVAAIGGLVVGPISDHVGYRRMIVIGLLLLAGSAVGVALSPSVPVLLAARVFTGLSAAITMGLSFALAAALFRGAARQRALSLVAGAFSSAAVVGLPVLTTISLAGSWRVAILSIAVFSILLTPLIIRVLPEQQRPPARRFTIGALARSYLPVIRDRPVAMIYFCLFFMGMALVSMVTYLSAYFDDRFSTSTEVIGIILAFAGGAYTIGSVAGGLSFFAGRLRGSFFLFAVLKAGGLVAMYVFDFGAVSAVGFMVVASASSGLAQVMLITLLSEESSAATGTTMVLQGSVVNLGAAGGVAIAGALLSVGSYPVLGVVLGSMALLAGLLITRR